jgi:hypothetical protein
MGLLIDASPLSVYKWEAGHSRPRAKHLAAIAIVRKMGKREVNKRLENSQSPDAYLASSLRCLAAIGSEPDYLSIPLGSGATLLAETLPVRGWAAYS